VIDSKKYSWIWIVTITILLLLPKVHAEDSLRKYKREGEAAMKAGKCDGAIVKFRQALRIDPGFYEIIPDLVKAYNCNGLALNNDARAALDQFVAAMEFSEDGETYEHANSMMRKLGQDPNSEIAWKKLSENYLSQYKYAEARSAYSIALRIHRKNVQSKVLESNSKSPVISTVGVTGKPRWEIANYFPVAESPYFLRLYHQFEMNWVPVKGLESTEVAVVFTLNTNGTISDVQAMPNKYGAGVTALPAEVKEAAEAAVKKVNPYEPMPPPLSRDGARRLSYLLNGSKPIYGAKPIF
jgi:tetratricopeptide (TPR) repeat protein